MLPPPSIQTIVRRDMERSPSLARITGSLCDEIERLRRLENLILDNHEGLEANDPHAIAKILRWIEFNPRPKGTD